MRIMNVEVVAHDPSWKLKFENEANCIRAALGSAVAEIHHIGSTSIPGIYAKPIIDMLLELTSIDAADEKAESLVTIGYEAMGEFGIPGRRYFHKNSPSGVREYQVHAFAVGSGEVSRHLAFRDYLRSHAEVARQYSELKRGLAKRYHSNIEAYMNGKDPFIKETQQAALTWWRST